VEALKYYQAEHSAPEEYCYVNIECIRADYGSQFTSTAFHMYCTESGINLFLAGPKKHDNYHRDNADGIINFSVTCS
jgi:hypothetical protein